MRRPLLTNNQNLWLDDLRFKNKIGTADFIEQQAYEIIECLETEIDRCKSIACDAGLHL